MSDSRLADYCSSIDYGYTTSACDDPAGPNFLRITDIVTGPPRWDQVPYCNADERIAAKFKLNDRDIVVARTGATTGVSSYIREPPPAVFASYLVRLTIDETVADARFASYYLKGPQFWDLCVVCWETSPLSLTLAPRRSLKPPHRFRL